MKIRQSAISALLIFAVLLLSACGGGGGSSDGNSGGGGSGGSGGNPPPGAPTGLTVTAGNAQVALSWTAVSGASGYTVYYSQASIASLTASGVIKVENISSAARTVTALTNGRRYYFVVTATNAGGESAASGEVSATPQASMASISGRLTFDLVPITNSGRENENTEEYDQTVVMHEFAHHVGWAMSREDSTGGRHHRNALLDMRVAFSEGFKRAFVKLSFAQSGAHTLTLTKAAGSRAANPRFRWPPYRGVAQRRSTSQWASAPRSATITGNFRAGEPLVLEAFDEQNTDSVTDNDGDSCFTFSVVKN